MGFVTFIEYNPMVLLIFDSDLSDIIYLDKWPTMQILLKFTIISCCNTISSLLILMRKCFAILELLDHSLDLLECGETGDVNLFSLEKRHFLHLELEKYCPRTLFFFFVNPKLVTRCFP